MPDPLPRPAGVSIAICTHNGAARIPLVLQHLAAQRGIADLAWEVLIVDNASSDGTAQVALAGWHECGAPAPFRVVLEPSLGLTRARESALQAARFSFVSFVDDDNLVSPDWVRTAYSAMEAHPSAGAVTGRNVAVVPPGAPAWFKEFGYLYAVGDFGDDPADVTDARPLLWGAGLTLRAEAWNRLVKMGFRLMLSDRTGTSLVSGGDCEIALALRRAGWRLRYDPQLELKHIITSRRLRWEYFRAVARGSGSATPALDPFYSPFFAGHQVRLLLRRWWFHQLIQIVRSGLRRPLKFCAPQHFLREGDPDAVRVEAARGRLGALYRMRGSYRRRFRELDALDWESARPGLR